MNEYDRMISDYRERVDISIDNVQDNYKDGNIEYCIRVLNMMIKIGQHIGDFETVEYLKEVLLVVIDNESEQV